jgi:hypothetical protein
MYLVHFNLAFSNNITDEVVLDINVHGLELIHVILRGCLNVLKLIVSWLKNISEIS